MKTSLSNGMALMAATLLAACGGQTPGQYGAESAALEGQVAEESHGSGSSSFASHGTLAATAQIVVSSVAPDGALTVVGTASLDASGHYRVEVPAHARHLIVRAVDTSGHALASVLVEASGEPDSTVTAATMTATNSAGAEVFLRMVAQGDAPEAIDREDLAARIDSRVAAQLRTEAEAGGDVAPSVDALATATIAAQAAMKAQAEASAKAQAVAASAASTSFRILLASRLSASVSDRALLEAASHAEAAMEARASAAAVEALLSAGGASQALVEAAASAGATLVTDVDAAADAEAVAQAFAEFQASIATSAQAGWESSIVGGLIEASGTGSTDASAQLRAMIEAEAQARAALVTAATVALGVTGEVRPEAVAQAVAQAYTAYDAQVRAHTWQALASMGHEATLSADLLVIADGAFLATDG